MQYALEHNMKSLMISQPTAIRWATEYRRCDAKPVVCRFNAGYHTTVEFSELTDISSITRNVNLVEFKGIRYIHKYMRPGDCQNSWEVEVRHYLQIQECEGVPRLAALVQLDGMNQGLLLDFIDGENLGVSAIGKSETELLAITYKIIKVAVGLEKVGYYGGDLKCGNILQQNSGAIYFVDFGGGATEGFYPEESEWTILSGDVDAVDGIYILGKALWQLWTDPVGTPAKELQDNIPEPARSIIYDCCISRKFATMEELQRTWCPAMQVV